MNCSCGQRYQHLKFFFRKNYSMKINQKIYGPPVLFQRSPARRIMTLIWISKNILRKILRITPFSSFIQNDYIFRTLSTKFSNVVFWYFNVNANHFNSFLVVYLTLPYKGAGEDTMRTICLHCVFCLVLKEQDSTRFLECLRNWLYCLLVGKFLDYHEWLFPHL